MCFLILYVQYDNLHVFQFKVPSVDFVQLGYMVLWIFSHFSETVDDNSLEIPTIIICHNNNNMHKKPYKKWSGCIS